MDMEYYDDPQDDEDGDFDIQIYESESEDAGFDDGDSSGSAEEEIVTHAQPRRPESLVRSHAMLPEDEPWPGIEDRELNGSDGENVDPTAGDDMPSDVSSQPSEYPSTQRAWPDGGVEGGFLIHEDEDEMER
jgi:hypothetical protein